MTMVFDGGHTIVVGPSIDGGRSYVPNFGNGPGFGGMSFVCLGSNATLWPVSEIVNVERRHGSLVARWMTLHPMNC
jgi:hypothetical protein